MNINTFQLILLVSTRSLWNHRMKNLVVGLIIFFGVFLLVVADAMLDSINQGMESSITASITGHLQLYDANAEDQLSMMGMMGNFLSNPQVGHIQNFKSLRQRVEQHPNVKALIPMGTDTTIVFSGNSIDQAVSEFRQALATLPPDLPVAEKRAQLAGYIVRIQMLTDHLYNEYQLIKGFSAKQTHTRDALKELSKVRGAVFWQNFFVDTTASIQFLETRIAPLMDDDQPIFMELLGTDLDRFQDSFSRFKIVKGEMVPKGQRGLLVNDVQYELVIKDRIARVFDQVLENRVEENIFIKDNRKLSDYIKRRAKEYKQWMLSFEVASAKKIEVELQVFLNDNQATLDSLIPEFLALNDENFMERYNFFYANIAPALDLYRIDIGDTITLKKFGEGDSQNVIFYGTYQFEGVEKSGFSALFHLVDLTTFRELYGFMTEEKQAQVDALKLEFNALEWERESVEDELFNENIESQVLTDEQDAFYTKTLVMADTDFEMNISSQLAREERQKQIQQYRHNQDEIDKGAVISASVVLKDETLLSETRQELEKLLKEANVPIQIIDWKSASGYVGQMISVMKIVLLIFMIFVFAVSMVVVNNAMLMATMNRYTEIGTLRAIGASRGVIMGVFLNESIILTIIASIMGAMVGIGLIEYLSVRGIPAPRMEFQFLFGGTHLYPAIAIENLYLGPVVILFVSVAATFYPALLATRISPVVAMNARE